MKVILFGASGMVGQGVLRECLLDPAVETVLAVSRSALGKSGAKLREIVRPNVGDLGEVEAQLRDYDACFFCLGVSSAGKSEADYTRVTHDLTLSVARTLVKLNPGMTFIYVSGAGADSTEQGRTMWARVRGRTENELLRLPFKTVCIFRPGAIQALDGIVSRTPLYRWLYFAFAPLFFLLKRFAPGLVTTTRQIGRAMILIAQRGAPKPILESSDINAIR